LKFAGKYFFLASNANRKPETYFQNASIEYRTFNCGILQYTEIAEILPFIRKIGRQHLQHALKFKQHCKNTQYAQCEKSVQFFATAGNTCATGTADCRNCMIAAQFSLFNSRYLLLSNRLHWPEPLRRIKKHCDLSIFEHWRNISKLIDTK
jgi:hypothetical protein